MIIEMMQGTAMHNEFGVAKKVGIGWKVNARNGKPFPSVRPGKKLGEMTNVVYVENKREARKILNQLEKANE